MPPPSFPRLLDVHAVNACRCPNPGRTSWLLALGSSACFVDIVKDLKQVGIVLEKTRLLKHGQVLIDASAQPGIETGARESPGVADLARRHTALLYELLQHGLLDAEERCRLGKSENAIIGRMVT